MTRNNNNDDDNDIDDEKQNLLQYLKPGELLKWKKVQID